MPIHNGADALVDLVVLDIAGTTVQEHGSVYVALHDAVAAAGGEPSSLDVAHWMGADKHEAIAALLSTDLRTRAGVTRRSLSSTKTSALEQAYRQRPPTPMDGVPQALARLRRQGVKVALTTGFTREVTSSLLGSLGWDDAVVDAVVTVDDVRDGRPAPYMIFRSMEVAAVTDVSRVLVAGDTTRDLQAGTNAGAGFVVGVLSGAMTAAALGRVRQTHLLAGVGDIPHLVL